MSEESEQKVITHLIEGFRRDVFRIYVGPGPGARAGGDLPETLKRIRGSDQRRDRAEFAWDRARSRMDDRLRDLRADWDLSPEALDHLEREVQVSSQILITCHTSIKSWQ